MTTPYQQNAKTPAGPIASTPAGATWGGFRGLLKQYSGAAAGYSLRKIGSGPVVRLRRASDNEERDFSAGELTGSSEGSELVTNGDFATDSDWTKDTGWSITGGQAVCDGTQVSVSQLRQNGIISSEAGVYYKITFTIVACSDINNAGTVIDSDSIQKFTNEYGISTTGTYSLIFKTTGTNTNFRFYAGAGVTFTLDDVSCVEYTPTTAELWALNDRDKTARQNSESAYATTWYDQSGSGNDATQTTAASQPLLIRAGVTNTDNGKAALSFDGVDDFIQNTSPSHTVASIAAVWNKGSGNNRVMFDGSTSATGANRIWRDFPNADTKLVNGASTLQATNSSGTDTQNLTFATNDGAGGGSISDNGETPITGTMGTTAMSAYRLGGGLGGLGFHLSYIQEVIIYDSDQSANRTGIETNINDHYGIY